MKRMVIIFGLALVFWAVAVSNLAYASVIPGGTHTEQTNEGDPTLPPPPPPPK